MSTALVPTGIITRCCDAHRVGPWGFCCDPDDCGPCCPECLTCPETQSWTAEHRRQVARDNRQWTVDFFARLRSYRAASNPPEA